MQKKLIETKKSTVKGFKNFVHLVEAIALLVVSSYSFYASQKYSFSTSIQHYALMGASVLIGVRAAHETMKYFTSGK